MNRNHLTSPIGIIMINFLHQLLYGMFHIIIIHRSTASAHVWNIS